MSGYSRQSNADIVPTAVVRSAPVNAEFNALRDAFAFATGHKHDGSSTEGAYIPLIADTDANNKVSVNTEQNRIEFYSEVSSAAVAQVYVQDGVILPALTNDIDLGSSALKYKNFYLNGTASVGAIVAATADINAGTIDGTIIGGTNAAAGTFTDLTTTGTSTHATVDINGGAIDGTTIGATTPSTVVGTTITANTQFTGDLVGDVTGDVVGDLTGDVTGNVTGNLTGNVTGNVTSTGTSTFSAIDVNGGAIDGTTIGASTPATAVFSSVTSTGATITSADINGGTVDNVTIGATTPSTIVGTTVTANTGFTGDLTGDVTGNVTGDLTGDVTGDITGDVTGDVTSAGTSTFNDVTISGTLNMNGATTATITNLTEPTNAQDAATKNYVDTAVSDLVDSAPAALDTLNELSAALGDDADFSTTITNSIATKLPLAGGTMSGDITMGANSITGLADPTANQDAATKAYVDATDATKLNLSGGTMTGNVVMGANKVTSTATPTADDDLTRKGYVDTILGSATAAATSAAAAATSESNAATSEATAAAFESSAATSASNASTSETSAANSASAALTSENNAAASETAAALSETNAGTSEADAASSASAASTSATNAATSATNASNSASAALVSEDNASSSESAAATSESAAAGSASAASTSEVNASNSEAAAATSESNAATSAINAAASELDAAISASNAAISATAAANSATAASSSASNAAASESAASTSEVNASTSESNAATSESNAAASAASAAASYDSFDDRYLGAKSSEPSTDNDGDALIVGALYFNSTNDTMYIYTGSAWSAAVFDTAGAMFGANNLSDVDNVVTSRANLGVEIGVDVQAYDANIVSDSSYVHTDNNYTTSEKNKLAGVEAGATTDQTAAEIKTAYESNTNTNAYTDTEKGKLAGVEAGADVTDTASVSAAGALMKSGGTMAGSLTLNANPTTSLQAATKGYVDTIAAAGLHYHDPVRVEKEGNLNVTYNNGTGGVGATLTNSGTQEALVIDGVTMVVGDRVLVYEQSDASQNGIYTVTNTGSASTNWVLTRATDADSYSPSDPDSLGQGDAFFVLEGTAGAGETYVMNTEGTITFGTSNITFAQVSSAQIYVGGTGVSIDGNEISIGQSVDTTDNVTFNNIASTGNITVSGTVDGSIVIDNTGSSESFQILTSNSGITSLTVDYNELNFQRTDGGPVYISNNGGGGVWIDSRDIAADGTKLDGIEAGADITDTANVTAAGALMDSEVTNLAQVKAFDSSNYATSAQGSTADSALQPGDNISTLTNDAGYTTNVGDITNVSAGTGLSGGGSSGSVTLNVDLSELTDMTAGMLGTDEFIVLDAGADRRKAASEIGLSIFNNDAGFTTNVGDITNVSTGGGLTGGGSSGSVSISHADTSSQGSVNNSGRTYIQDITLDTYGHITGISSATETVVNTTYSAGTALDLSGTTFNVDLSELSTSTTNGDGDYFVVTDTSNVQRKLTKGNINISGFNNDAGYTTNVGDITSIIAGTGLSGGGTSGAVSISHADTSSLSGAYGSTTTGTSIDQIAVDANGHVTAITTGVVSREVVGSISGSTVNLSTGNVFSHTVSSNITYSFSNPPSSGVAYGFTFKVTMSGTRTITWPSSVHWAEGTAPDAPESGATNVYVFYTQDGGSTYYGFLAGGAMA